MSFQVAAVLKAGSHTHLLGDNKRGSLAMSLEELLPKPQVGTKTEEDRVPEHDRVRAACEMLPEIC